MAIYHCHISIGKGSAGKNAVGRAAYCSGEKIKDNNTNLTFDHTSKEEVIHSEILLPDNAPDNFKDRSKLWNEVQKTELNSKAGAKAQLYREFEISLPIEFQNNPDKLKEISRHLADNLRKNGMICDLSIHNKPNNPHVHILTPLRRLDAQGRFMAKCKNDYKRDEAGNKIPLLNKDGSQKIDRKTGRKLFEREKVDLSWNGKEYMEQWRSMVADTINKHLVPDKQIDHRSYKRQGQERIPQLHHHNLSSRKAQNLEINNANKRMETISNDIKGLQTLKTIETAKIKGGGGRAVGSIGVMKLDNRQLSNIERQALLEQETPEQEEDWSIDLGGMSYGRSGIDDVVGNRRQVRQPAEPVRQSRQTGLDLQDRGTGRTNNFVETIIGRAAETKRRIAEIRRRRADVQSRELSAKRQIEQKRHRNMAAKTRKREPEQSLELSR